MSKPHNPEMSWHVWVLHQESMRLLRLMYRLNQEVPQAALYLAARQAAAAIKAEQERES